MTARAPRILVSAGEPSGDLHAAGVVKAIRQLLPNAVFEAVGGPRLEAAGAEPRFPMERLSQMGFGSVLASLPLHYRLFQSLRDDLIAGRYDLAILVDYPGLHLRVARAARAAGVPVLYYIAPQLWAWRPERATRLRSDVDRLAVILPFEADFFSRLGVPATYVGHPLLDRGPWPSRTEARLQLGISLQGRVLGIFPGSRNTEIGRHWPRFRDAALELLNLRVCDQVIVAATAKGSYPHPGPITLYRGDPTPVFAAADVALAKSGTTTLEAALADTPMVVSYAASRLTRAIGKRLMTVKWISLVNLIAGRAVVPEFWRDPVSTEALVEAARPLFESESESRKQQLAGLAEVRARLGEAGAASRVAHLALQLVGA